MNLRVARDFNLRVLKNRPAWTLASSLVPVERFYFTPEERELARIQSYKERTTPFYRKAIRDDSSINKAVVQQEPLEKLASYFASQNPSISLQETILPELFAKKQLQKMTGTNISETEAYKLTMKDFGFSMDEKSHFLAKQAGSKTEEEKEKLEKEFKKKAKASLVRQYKKYETFRYVLFADVPPKPPQ